MNYEPGAISAEPLSTETPGMTNPDNPAAVARRRRNIKRAGIGAAVAAALVAGYFVFAKPAERTETSSTTTTTVSKAGGAAGKGRQTAPRVTVIVPGRTQVARIVSATGSLAARREMPVGVAGEGGQVTRVWVEPGQWVRAGQVLATVDRQVQTQQLAQLRAQIAVAQADANLAQSELARASQLVARGFVSRADIERRTAQRDAAAARVNVVRAQLAEAQARTGRLDIRAPDNGLVLSRSVEPGQIVSPGSGVLFRIARGGEMEMRAQVSEGDLAAISTGVRAEITPVGSDRSFNGQVWQIAPIIDPATRQGTARIAVPYAAGLRPGGFAEARIMAGGANAPLLPQSAVQSDDDGSYVYIVGANNKVERRNVQIGTVTDNGVAIAAGLDGTEAIVQSAAPFLTVGQTVVPVREAAAAPSSPQSPSTPAPSAAAAPAQRKR